MIRDQVVALVTCPIELAEPFAETTWASHIDLETGRPVEIPGARYEDGQATITPTLFGAHNWHAMSFNPATGLAYYPAIHLEVSYSDVGVDLTSFRSQNWMGGLGVNWEMVGSPRSDGATSSLQAWDPVRQELA